MRPFVNLSETIAGYRSNRSPLLIMLTEPAFCRNSSINISIDNRYDNDLFTSGDRYSPWITTAPVFTIPTTLGIAHARVTLARHRSPNLRTGCRIIITQQLDSLTVPSTPYVFNNFLLLVPPACWYKLHCNRFNGHERLFFSASAPNNPPFLPVGALWLPVIAQWL